MSAILLFNKPFNVLSQFTSEPSQTNLSAYLADFPGFYAAGRLDKDSEGLLLLTSDGALQHRIASPKHKLPKTYWAQVEGQPDASEIALLESGVQLNDGPAKASSAVQIAPPHLWERDPEVRPRVGRGTAWVELVLTEGRNRQVRRMTAAIGYPTLRLVRAAIGPWSLGALQPGEWKKMNVHLPAEKGKRSRGKSARSRRRSF